jgi:VWFA-related protein
VAIFLLSDRLYILQTFTGDPQLLLTVLKRTKSRSPTSSTNSALLSKALVSAELREEEAIEGFEAHEDPFSLKSGSAAEAEFLLRDRIERTTSALVAVGNYLAQFPGRKNLLWVSSAFPNVMGGGVLRSDTFGRELRKTSNALNNADMAIYPVDARGLFVEGLPGWQDASTPNLHWMPPVPGDLNGAACFSDTHGTMDELADDTGGRAYYNTNGLMEAMRSAVDDSYVNYTLGFYPHIKWDGQYHELEVKVTRPGVHLRARKGYYATLDIPEGKDQTASLFDRALYSPLDSTALGLNVTLQKITSVPAKRATFEIVMDPHDITFQDKNGDKTVVLEMLIAQLGADGKVLQSFRQVENLRIAGKGMSQVLSRGLTLGKWVGLVDGATTLELVVRDPASGNVGSVRIPLGT